jgi:hypothetical protein
MRAELIYHIKDYFKDGSFKEIKIWRVPVTKDKPHGLKYSFVYIVGGERVLGYDNAEGRGDHKHYKAKESAYAFQDLGQLWKDFHADLSAFREGKQ